MTQWRDDPGERIDVVCPTCRARLYPRREWAGRRVRCPDCHSAVPVPARAPPSAPAAPARPDPGEYAVNQGAAAVAAPPQSWFLVVCPTCRARLHPRLEEVGSRIRCPDCGLDFIVPPPSAPAPPPRPIESGQYDVGSEPQRAPVEMEYLTVLPYLAAEPSRPVPAMWYWTGVVDFPWRGEALARWANLTLLLLGAGEMTTFALVATGAISGSIGTISGLTLPFFGLASFWLWWWSLSYAAACVMGVVQDTAAGNDEVDRWPAPDWREWTWPLLEIGYLAGLSLAGGYLAARLLAYGGASQPLEAIVAVVTPIVVFPVLLLSALEADTPLVPASPLILRSLFSNWWAWTIAYVELLLLVGGIFSATAAGLVRAPYLTVFVASPVVGALVLIGARLLGRLAWRVGMSAMDESRERRDRQIQPRATRGH